MLKQIIDFLKARIRLLSLTTGLLFIVVWTVIRSFTNGVNFDVVGQIGVARQWMHGLHSGAELGATHYLLKFPLYMIVNSFEFLDPHFRLLLLALVCNIATYILLFILAERFAKLYDFARSTWFYITLIWVGVISERIFWLDYANSRNIEVVGGIAVLYFSLLALKQFNRRNLTILGLLSTIVFFSDQLQIFCIGGGIVLYLILHALLTRTRQQTRINASIIATLGVAVLSAKLLLLLSAKLLPISFLVAPAAEKQFSFMTVQGNLVSMLKLVDVDFWAAGSAPNMLRQILCLMLVSVLLLAYLRTIAKNKQYNLAVVCCIITSFLAYSASGQALLAGTERYLIMVPVLLALLFMQGKPHWLRQQTHQLAILLVALCGMLTFGGLAVSWQQRYQKDQRIYAVLTFMKQQNYAAAVSSRDAIVANYFADEQTMSPVICQPGKQLISSNLFYDQAGFASVQKITLIPLLVPSGGIVSGNEVCDMQAITQQLGQPLKIQSLPGFGDALLYKSSALPIQTYSPN